jgi:uncharacterized protein (DUF433 family)
MSSIHKSTFACKISISRDLKNATSIGEIRLVNNHQLVRHCFLWYNFSEVKAMQLEDYFDFQAPNDIRIKGHRIGIENVLYEYIHRKQTPEEIAVRFDTLTLEEIYATILYYLHNKEQVDKYIADWIEFGRRAREEQNRNPSPAILKLRKIKAERLAAESKAEYKAE